MLSVSVTKVGGNTPVNGIFNVTPPGPWLVEGTLTETGGNVISLTWQTDLFTPPSDIAPGAAWSFNLPASFLQVAIQATFWVEGIDDAIPTGFANTFAVVQRTTIVAPPPVKA